MRELEYFLRLNGTKGINSVGDVVDRQKSEGRLFPFMSPPNEGSSG